ncbi:transposase [Cardinium endosymbiont of Oedothorax gibbosus]|uniref:transposase n=1 Tax=Cardinium endosymbiont of Oedothorax gibbosus TaxID=931101 RepID=UPI002024B33A|nr:transposase [Cardinium endosymbiont of Oedothorax gibbosus]
MRIIKQIKDLPISICLSPLLRSISNSQARVAAKCQEAYQAIEATIEQSKVLHIDKTSHYNSGELGWCWICTSPKASLLKRTPSSSRKVLESSGLHPNAQR